MQGNYLPTRKLKPRVDRLKRTRTYSLIVRVIVTTHSTIPIILREQMSLALAPSQYKRTVPPRSFADVFSVGFSGFTESLHSAHLPSFGVLSRVCPKLCVARRYKRRSLTALSQCSLNSLHSCVPTFSDCSPQLPNLEINSPTFYQTSHPRFHQERPPLGLTHRRSLTFL